MTTLKESAMCRGLRTFPGIDCKHKQLEYTSTFKIRTCYRSNWPNLLGTSEDGRRLTIWFVYGPNSCQWANQNDRGWTKLLLVLPPFAIPNHYDYRLLIGHDVIAVSAGQANEDYQKAVFEAAFKQGITRVFHMSTGGLPCLHRLKK